MFIISSNFLFLYRVLRFIPSWRLSGNITTDEATTNAPPVEPKRSLATTNIFLLIIFRRRMKFFAKLGLSF
jgi:hypothetical protein